MKKKSIFSKISKNFHFRQIFFLNFEFGLNFWKFGSISILVKSSKKTRSWWKFSILVIIFAKFSSTFRNNSILVKCSKNFDFNKKFWTISIFPKFRKITILVKFSKNFALGQIFETIRFRSKLSRNVDSFANFEKISILVKIYAKFRFLWKFSKNFENFEILWFEWNFRNKFGFDQNFRFFRKFRKVSIWVRFSWH